jgi:LPS-assembly lipoprotein
MKKLIIALITTTLVSACGWHLRGSSGVPLDINSVFVTAEDSYGSLISSLKQSLASSQVKSAAKASDAQYTIVLSNETQDRRTVSVGNNAFAAEYELTLSVDYVIQDSDGNIISAKSTASSFRAYDFDRDAVVAKNEEERLILSEMRSNVVQQILRRLRFVSQAEAKKPAISPEQAESEADGKAAS